jgi:phosphatidylglycerol---prolipoprotein diacylglyceryl transferase
VKLQNMIPYFEHPVWHVGPFSIHAFGIAVGIALWLGVTFADKRFAQLGLDAQRGGRLAGWMIGAGVIGSHLFSVLLYFPERVRQDPLILLRVWDPISSFGGMLGGVIGAWLFFATRKTSAERQNRMAYLDVIAFVFPAALAMGRLGCALAHDHPGRVTDFPLAVSLKSSEALAYISEVYQSAGLALPQAAPTMGFHDLGLYEFLYLTFIVVPLFALLNRRTKPAGFYLATFASLYLPVRFCLDMLRVADVRYFGFTPAQWTAAVIMALLPFFVVRRRTLRFALSGAVILAAGLACAGAR